MPISYGLKIKTGLGCFQIQITCLQQECGCGVQAYEENKSYFSWSDRWGLEKIQKYWLEDIETEKVDIFVIELKTLINNQYCKKELLYYKLTSCLELVK